MTTPGPSDFRLPETTFYIQRRRKDLAIDMNMDKAALGEDRGEGKLEIGGDREIQCSW